MTDLQAARDKSLATWEEMSSGWQANAEYLWNTSRHVTEWLVDRAAPRSGETVLDVASGPGDSGFTAAKRIGDSGHLISTDFSPQMVEVARARGESLGIDNVEFKQMDAEKMDLADESVDVILCKWGFMLMLDPATALKECHRVLRPGGRLALSVWGGPEQNPWITVMGMVMMQQGHTPQGDPFGPGGMFSMAEPDTIKSMLADAGFENVEVEPMDVHWKFDDLDGVWDFATELAGAIAALIKQLPPDKVDEFRKAVGPAVEPYRSGDGYDFPGVTMNAAGTKP